MDLTGWQITERSLVTPRTDPVAGRDLYYLQVEDGQHVQLKT